MPKEIITKLDAAHRQLAVAISLYFEKGDSVAIHSLACAAREIYEKLCILNKRHRLLDEIKKWHHQATENELLQVLNRARNFFKHINLNGSPDQANDTEELNDNDNKLTLFMAAYDCSSLLGDSAPMLFKRYVTWFVATEPVYREHFPGLDEKFPGLHEADETVQRMAGQLFVTKTLLPNGTSWP